MTGSATYLTYRKWIIISCLLTLPFIAAAQYADTVVSGEVTAANDSIDLEDEQKPDTVILRATPDSVIEKLKHEKTFAYANDPAYWVRETEEPRRETLLEKLFRSTGFNYLLLGLLFAILLYAIVNILATNKILLFKSRKKYGSSATDEEILEQADLTNLIAESEAQQQYRLAARYRYLQLLQVLQERQLIRLNSQLTNWDYVRQLATHPLGNNFRYLTQAYDYVWYGDFELDADQYNKLKTRFETIIP